MLITCGHIRCNDHLVPFQISTVPDTEEEQERHGQAQASNTSEALSAALLFVLINTNNRAADKANT